jgi:hypothetical protein
MFAMKTKIRIAAVAILAATACLAHAQSYNGGHSLANADPVQYLFPEQVSVTAGRPSSLVLHFRIAPGMHINSHAPREDYLIPTTFSIADGAGVRLDAASYPAGTDVTLPIDPRTKLNVYTGEFTIQARIVAAPGNHLMEGKLRFQACDRSQCLPPRTIPVAIDVIGK